MGSGRETEQAVGIRGGEGYSNGVVKVVFMEKVTLEKRSEQGFWWVMALHLENVL